MKAPCDGSFGQKLLTGLLLLFAVLMFFSPSFHDKYFGVAKYESAAVGSLDKINALENQYAASRPDKAFACELAVLRPQESGRSGYRFAFGACAPEPNGIVTQYQIFAVPVRPGITGIRAFCTNQTGNLFYDLNGSPSECLASRREIP